MKFYGKLVPPVLSTSERNALIGVDTASVIFNSTTLQYEYWDGLIWKPLVDTTNISNTPLGSVDKHSDVDTTTVLPIAGDNLRWDGANWVPSSASGASGNNYVFAHSEHFQAHSTTGVWRSIVFNNRSLINGWTYTEIIASGTGTLASPYIVTDAYFTAPGTGLYGVTIESILIKTAGGTNSNVAISASLNNVIVDGSQNGMDLISNNNSFSVSRTFLMNVVSIGQLFRAQWAVSATPILLAEAPSGGGALPAADQTSSALTIRRLT